MIRLVKRSEMLLITSEKRCYALDAGLRSPHCPVYETLLVFSNLVSAGDVDLAGGELRSHLEKSAQQS